MGLPCIVGKCAADNARKRLASGDDLHPLERDDCEAAATGCDGEQPDPWNKKLRWKGCPAKAAFARPDIDSALTVRGLAAISPLEGWPRIYVPRVVEILSLISHEERLMRAEEQP